MIQDWVSAYNARDPYAPIELYHEDAQNHQVAFGDPLNGREALLESFVTFFPAFRDNYTHVENLFEDGEWAIVEWTGGGTSLGEFGGNLPTGKSFTLKAVASFRLLMAKSIFNAVT